MDFFLTSSDHSYALWNGKVWDHLCTSINPTPVLYNNVKENGDDEQIELIWTGFLSYVLNLCFKHDLWCKWSITKIITVTNWYYTVLVKSGGSEMCPCLFISSFRKVSVMFYTMEVSVSRHCMPPLSDSWCSSPKTACCLLPPVESFFFNIFH